MPIRDIEAMNQSLANDYGTSETLRPPQHELALFSGDPLDSGVEITGGGYARVEIEAADWAEPADGAISTIDPVVFPAPTEEWSDTVTHAALIYEGVMWDCFPLAEPLEVTGVGSGPSIDVEIFHADILEAEEEDF